MASSMRWDGLKEFREELRKLPEECRGEAAKVVEGEVNAAYVTVKRVYEAHRFTGFLSSKLAIQPLKVRGALTTGLVLKSGSPLAWLFDNGTQARHYITVNGVTHQTGRMPGFHVFGRTVAFTRRKIRNLLIEMVRRHGATKVIDDGR
jgi:hypothetical protein